MNGELAVFRGPCHFMTSSEDEAANMSSITSFGADFVTIRLRRRARAMGEWALILEMLDEKDNGGTQSRCLWTPGLCEVGVEE